MLPPLAVFLGLAGRLLQGRSFVFDLPLLASAHALSGPFADAVSMTFSRLGYAHGVIPTDVLLVVVSVWRRRWPAAAFATAALAGSGLLNMACKRFFARPRPALWESIAPESSFSFPSAHAMGSMTLATVLILLAWPGRWRWPVVVAMLVFVPLVGFSRVYLGVHYPSDVLAGWAAALAWTFACRGVVSGSRSIWAG